MKPQARKREKESCWSLAKRRAEHVRKRAKRRKPGFLRDLITSPEGVFAILAGVAVMNVIRVLGAALGEAIVALWVAAARRREVARVQPKSDVNAPPVVLPAAIKRGDAMSKLNLQSALSFIEARSRGHRVPPVAPSSADAWSVVELHLSPDAMLYLRQVEAEGGGAWTPVKYDAMKRPSEAPEIWRTRGQAIREEAEAEALKPAAKPKVKPDGDGKTPP